LGCSLAEYFATKSPQIDDSLSLASTKKAPCRGLDRDEEILDSQRVEEQIREESVELDHDSGCDREPDGRKDRSSGEELFHGAVLISGGKR
jgi:hypothetical protein